jgi:hypothetical protein
MSETIKKKPDFNKLDFSKITSGEVSNISSNISQSTEQDITQTTKPIKEGTWIYGKDIKDVTTEEFKSWLSDLLPGTGVDKWEEKGIATPKDREKVITRLSLTLHKVFCFPRTLPVDNKEYVN